MPLPRSLFVSPRPADHISISSNSETDQEPEQPSESLSPSQADFLGAPTVHRSRSYRSSKSACVSTLCSSPNDDVDGKYNPELPWKSGDEFYEVPKELQTPGKDPWEVAYDLAQNHDKVTCNVWREEIDHLIVFAGLFSATVVAFLAISYQMLKPDPTAIQNQVYIGLYTVWVAAFQANGNIVDMQIPPPPIPAPSPVFTPSASVIRMNVVWFLSLTLSLGTVLIGIVCLQWIREFERDARRGPKEAFALRQMRYDGINYWKVPLIISALPVLLQSSLLLFFWGMQEFLWALNSSVTLINSIVIGAILFFIIATITLPALQCIFIRSDNLAQHQCPYKSPQARIFSWFAFQITLLVIKTLQLDMFKGPECLTKKREFLERLLNAKWWDWVSFDSAWQRRRMVSLPGSTDFESCDLPRGLAWLARKYVHKRESMQALHHLIRNTHPSTGLSALKKLCQMDTWSNLNLILKFESQWKHPSCHDNIISDILVAFLLNNQVQRNHRQHLPLLTHRVELLIRTANYRLGINTITTEEQPLVDLIDSCLQEQRCAINPFPSDYDYTNLSDVYKHQLLWTFMKHLEASIFSPVLWSIVGPMVFQATRPTSPTPEIFLVPLLGTLKSFNEDLEHYFRQCQILSQSQLQLKLALSLILRVFQYLETKNGKSPKSPSQCLEFSQDLYSLKNVLESYIDKCFTADEFVQVYDQTKLDDEAMYYENPAFRDLVHRIHRKVHTAQVHVSL